MLSDTQVDRYSRQIILPEVGARGQEKLLSTSFALVDLAEGSSILPLYLAAAGIGRLKIWTPEHADRTLADLSDMNPDCAVEVSRQAVTPQACEAFVTAGNPTAVILIEDSPELAVQVNAACVKASTPLLWGQAVGALGHVALFNPRAQPGCRACLRVPAPSNAMDGSVFHQLTTATLASFVACEAIKLALGTAPLLAGRTLRIDLADAAVTTPSVTWDPGCAVCGERPLQ